MTILRFVSLVLPMVSLAAPGAVDRPFEEMQQWSDQAGRTMKAKLVRVWYIFPCRMAGHG